MPEKTPEEAENETAQAASGDARDDAREAVDAADAADAADAREAVDAADAAEAARDAEDAAKALDRLYDETPDPREELEVMSGPSAAERGGSGEHGAGASGDGDAGADDAAPAKPHRNRRKAAGIVVAVFVVLLAAVYFGGVWYFQGHLMPNTLIGEEDVSGTSAQALARETGDLVNSYTAHVSGDGLDFEIEGSEVGLSYDGEAYARAAIEQTQPWLWPFKVWQPRALVVERTVTLDRSALKDLLRTRITKVNRDGVEPQDAEVVYDASVQRFAPKQEEKGTKLDLSATLKKVRAGMLALEAEVELGDDELKQPKITSTDQRLVSAAQQANQFLKARVALTVNDKTVMTIEPDQVAAWVLIDSDFNASLDEDAVKNWCLGPVSRKFDTIGAKRVYKLKVGKKTKKVTVSGGTYGWSTDSESLAEKIVKRIQSGSSKKLEIPMKSTGAKWNPGGADWKAYIDIDLTTQMARYYNAKGKVVWSSAIVSGNPSANHATPTGVYVINDTMGTNQTLIGSDENGDGKPDYTSHVDYWMPFVGNSVALHDADWRSSFGGSIYLTNGSHGCVNLPPAKAKELYGMVKPGVVVSCHK